MKRLIVPLIGLLAVGGCTSGTERAAPPEFVPAPVETPTTAAPVLRPADPYATPPNEIEPEVKRAAAAALQALFSYPRGGGTVEAGKTRLAAVGAVPEAAENALRLLDESAAATADIIYPQLGGLTPTAASVMTVVRLRQLGSGPERSVVRTMDVRLERRSGTWTVVELASLGGDPVPRPPSPSAAALRVLDHPQIDLPDTARWDIHSGRIADRVLDTLADIADERPVGVTVLSTGHPIEVFGSTHISNHIPGRAVDLWKIGSPVIDQRAASGPLRPLVERLLSERVTELGAPFDVDGPGGSNFANVVHQDHLHVAFDRL